MEIYNPGTFPLGYTPQDFIDGRGSSVKRNPLLAQLMYYVKDIESFGTGIMRISNECKSAGVKVAFEIRKLGFAVVFYRPEIHQVSNVGANNGVNVGANDNSVGVNSSNVGVNGYGVGVNSSNVGANGYIVGVNETQLKLINLLSESPRFTALQLCDKLGITKRRVESNLRTLKAMNLIERVGAAKNGYWVVKLPNVPEQ